MSKSNDNGRLGFSSAQRERVLSRRGYKDEEKYDRKARRALLEQLPLLMREGLVEIRGVGDRRTVKAAISVNWLELPRLRYGKSGPPPSSGEGDTRQMGADQSRESAEKEGDQGAGDKPGKEFYETELSFDEIQRSIFKDLGLPFLERKKVSKSRTKNVSFDDVRHLHTVNRLDINRTAVANVQRNAEETGRARLGDLSLEDLRVRVWREEPTEESKSVAIVMRDTSGTMGKFESYVARAVSWWIVSFLKLNYHEVEQVFVVHDYEATEVSEEAFFSRGSSGGTRCSSAIGLASDIIYKRFPTDEFNVYIVHFSDGDNSPRGENDNSRCVEMVEDLLERGISQFAYVQIKQRGGLLHAYEQSLHDPRFVTTFVNTSADVAGAVQEIFNPERELASR